MKLNIGNINRTFNLNCSHHISLKDYIEDNDYLGGFLKQMLKHENLDYRTCRLICSEIADDSESVNEFERFWV